MYNDEHYEWKKQEQHNWKSHLEHRIYFLFIKVLFSRVLADPLFNHLRKRGVPVIFWVINNKSDFTKCLTYQGCVGIMTDSPTLLNYFLQSNKSLVYKKNQIVKRS